MKKKTFLALLVLLVIITGCSNKTSSPAPSGNTSVQEGNKSAQEENAAAQEGSTAAQKNNTSAQEDSTEASAIDAKTGTAAGNAPMADADYAVLKPAHIQGAIFGGDPKAVIPVQVGFNPEWITTFDNTAFNKNLASFCSIAAADTYFREKDLDAGSANRVIFDDGSEDEYTVKNFMAQMGFEDVEFVETFRNEEYTSDPNDNATFIMAYADVDDKYDTFAFVFRGVFSIQEWLSAFGPGEGGDHHRGIEIAADRAMDSIKKYMETHNNHGGEDCVLIAGHSRGGGIANLVGAAMEDDENVRSYTYTISALKSVFDDGGKEYKTIFNLADERDFFVRLMSFGDAAPVNYGTDIYMDIGDSPNIRAAVADLKGEDDYAAVSMEDIEKFTELWHERFPERGTIYDTRVISEEYDTKKEATDRAKELDTLISSEGGLGLEAFVERNEPKGLPSGKYKVDIEYCDGGLLQAYAKALAYGNSGADAALSIFREDKGGCEIAEFLKENRASIVSGHRIINVYTGISMR